MQVHKVIEIIFTLLILIFLAMLVMGLLIVITVVQELAEYEVSFGMRVFFISGMTLVYFYIIKMVINRIRDYSRYI